MGADHNDNASIPTAIIAAAAASTATPVTAAMPVSLAGNANWRCARNWVTEICSYCPLQEQCRYGCYRCGLAHFRHLSREYFPRFNMTELTEPIAMSILTLGVRSFEILLKYIACEENDPARPGRQSLMAFFALSSVH